MALTYNRAAMTLRELIEGAGLQNSSPSWPGREAPGTNLSEDDLAVEIGGLAYRSETVEPGSLFFCVRGFTADGHDFAGEAVARGAAALVCDRPLDMEVPEVVVDDVRAAMAPIAATFFGRPSSSLTMVGVTGTNGKTTTTFLLRHVLEATGRRTGLLGTVQSVVGGQMEEVERTTPEAVDLQRSLRRMVDAGDDACVMEVSSHALELHRADAIEFDCVVFTNLTQDHLDFHGTLESYFGAKRRLFVAGGSPTPRVPLINIDDEWGRMLTEELAEGGHTETVTFAVEREADYRAHDVDLGPAGSTFVCHTPGGEVPVRLGLPGVFNVYNALAALAAATSVGVELGAAADALSGAQHVPGRFEPIDEGQEFSVLVDYAHTPDSLASVLWAARKLLGGNGSARLVCVFGAGGDRDQAKRPLMGEAARRLADHVIVTSDNPRSEDPESIIAGILEGAERVAGESSTESVLEVEPDRRAAIAAALRKARAGDVVVIAGKGHEQGQEFEGGRKIPFDDREVARSELRSLIAK
jgi:UDP-N-acetylmuramoyl-L-alanyl-D-glutamate--2,6-diaminopimelate ligase